MRTRRKRKTKVIPITGLSLFIAETKPIVEAEQPELTKMEVCKFLNEQWEELDDDIRKGYEKRADYDRRTEARREFYQKKKKTRNRMKGAISAYSVFLKARHAALKESNPEMTLSERTKTIAGEWNSMSKEDRIPFVNLAKRETRKIRKVNLEEESRSETDSDIE